MSLWVQFHPEAIKLYSLMQKFPFHVVVTFIIISRYVENAFPGKYGVPRKWYFPFQKSYWTGNVTKENNKPTNQDITFGLANDLNEAEPSQLTLGVSIHNLVKIYRYILNAFFVSIGRTNAQNTHSTS